jgi:hypothetical protein
MGSIDDSLNQFGFFQIGHGVVTTLKFIAGELVAIFQKGNCPML